MKQKQLLKKALAGIFACAVIVSSTLPMAGQNPSQFPTAITASASSCCSFDQETGVLTLSGNINKAEVQQYKNMAKTVRTVGAIFPADSSEMFRGFKYATSIDLSGANTRKVTNISYMFTGCSKVPSLNLGTFSTVNCTNMRGMFSGCEKIKHLNLNNFSTSRVTDMSEMFWCCHSLEDVDLSSFNTCSVTDMNHMFCACNVLQDIVFWRWNTDKVKNMSEMFSYSVIDYFDIRAFSSTTNVTKMSHMFCDCQNLTEMNLKGLDTSNVTNMEWMFNCCSSLTSLDLSKFNTRKVKKMAYMFSQCLNLRTIYASNQFETLSVTYAPNWKEMFQSCGNLVGGNGTKFDPTKTGRGYARIDKPGQKGYFTEK